MRSALILSILILMVISVAGVIGQDFSQQVLMDNTTVEQKVSLSEDFKDNSEKHHPTYTPTITEEDRSIIPEANAQEIEYGIPVKISVSKIGLDAPIIQEGKTPEGRMGVPEDNATVGWWKLGRKPGEVGSSVLAGHYRIDDGSPGVFFRLNELGIGDEITVTDEVGVEQVFEITNTEVYSEKKFPLEFVFARRDLKRLNLITCTGDYIQELNDYSHRLVLFTELIE